ncbi:hypothetical protein SDC9_165005 [bioreactor metagenome]|uniref:Uncharacterized protein n=1 Tax=bioreactor metagenome TaxID=1076179 RepID=A0A645FVD1_9ZZZZ
MGTENADRPSGRSTVALQERAGLSWRQPDRSKPADHDRTDRTPRSHAGDHAGRSMVRVVGPSVPDRLCDAGRSRGRHDGGSRAPPRHWRAAHRCGHRAPDAHHHADARSSRHHRRQRAGIARQRRHVPGCRNPA